MSALFANDFGPFLSIHDFIDQQKIPPSAKRLWAAIFGFYREHGSVYLCRAFFAKKLSLRKETISRALRVLEKIGVINRTGELKFGFYPCVELLAPNDAHRAMKPADSQPVIKRSPLSDHPITEQRSLDHSKKNKEEHIKEQNVNVLSKREFSSNEKIAVKQRLKTIGLHKHSIDKLMAKFSVERINAQIRHLQGLLERGDEIKNPAAWLIAAVEKGYELFTVHQNQTVHDDPQSELARQAAILAQTARAELIEGNHLKAKQTASKSIEIAPNSVARDVLKEANRALERIERIERAQHQMPLEVKQQIRLDAENEKSKEMRRWFKSDAEMRLSQFFKGAVEALVNQRLIAAG